MMRKEVFIGGAPIGGGHPCFVIAEAGVNHNGDPELAKQLVDAAADAGADAVKFQTFTAERLAAKEAPMAAYQRENTGADESQYEMLKRLEMSEDMHREVMAHCRTRSILFLSSPFDETSADLLEALDVPAFKIPSGEITNLPFLEYVAGKGRPIILSTGMSWLDEVDVAVRAIRRAGNEELVLLHCVSNYPADPKSVNLRAMQTLQQAFRLPVGYSDHTTGRDVALAAVALGAAVLEKHFTLDRRLPGPDHRASLEADELAALVREVRRVEAALGDGQKQPAASESDTAAVARKSLIALADISKGMKLLPDMVGARRPGTGLAPTFRDQVIGKTARKDIAAGTMLDLSMLT